MKKRPEAVCTVALIVINVAVFLILSAMGDTEDAVFMMNHGGMYEPLIVQEHEYYRLFTSMFLHFGMSHLLNNMVLLGALGWNLELETGKIKFLIIYLVSGLGGNLLSLYHDWRTGCFGRCIGRYIWSDGGSALCSNCKQRKTGKAFRQRHAFYDCTQSVLRSDQYRCRQLGSYRRSGMWIYSFRYPVPARQNIRFIREELR